MILITGCSGYIGSQIAHVLNKSKIKFIGIDNLKCSYHKNFKFKNNFHKLDISNKKIKRLIHQWNVTTIIHSAAYAYVNEGEKNKNKYYLNNVKNTKKFINYCIQAKVKNFIFLSSSNVYKDTKNVFTEKTKIDPKNNYGKNKIEIENFLKKKTFKSKVILRLFNIIGISRKFYIFKPKIRYQRIFFRLLDRKFKPKIKYYLDKKIKEYPHRDFVDVKDLGNLIVKIIRKLKIEKINNTFNVGSGKSISIFKLYGEFKKFKKISKPIFILLKKEELLKTKADISKTKRYFKWKPVIKLNNSIKSTIKLSKI